MVNAGDKITLDPNQGGFAQTKNQLDFKPNRLKYFF